MFYVQHGNKKRGGFMFFNINLLKTVTQNKKTSQDMKLFCCSICSICSTCLLNLPIKTFDVKENYCAVSRTLISLPAHNCTHNITATIMIL